jgi:tetratricopeptide (TPR) repeat protein
MSSQTGPFQYIKDAIEHGTDLERAVDKALFAYKSRPGGKTSQDMVNLTPRSSIDRLLESLLSESRRDQRFLPVFDLIQDREPKNVNVLEAKAFAWLFVDPLEVIDALIQAIALLEEKGGEEKNIPGLYKILGQTYSWIRRYDQAIQAFSMAMDYTAESEGLCPRHYRAMRMRVYQYLKNNQEEMARKDARTIYNLYRKDVLPELLERFEKEQQRKW